MNVLDTFAHRTTDWLLTRPRQVGAVLALLLVGCGAALTQLRVEAGTSAFLADEDPARTFLDEVEAAFTGDELIFVGYETADPFSHDSLAQVRALGDTVLELEAPTDGGTRALVEDVVSLATVKDVSGADMSFRTIPLVPEDIPTDATELAAIRTRALNNPMIRDGLLSASAPGVAALVARLRPGLDDSQKAHAVNAVRSLTAELAAKGGTTFHVTGGPVSQVDVAHYMQQDLATFIPVSYLLLLVLMYLFTRRVAGVVLAIVNATVAILFGMGTLALVGTLTNLSTIMPPLLMVLSVATVVHFLTEYAVHTHATGRDTAARKALGELFVPAFMCELTTAVGFISFVFSTIPALRDFGVAAAIAVMGSFFTSFLVLGLAVRWFGAERLMSSRGVDSGGWLDRAVVGTTDLAIRRPKTMLATMVAVTALAGAGLAILRIDQNTVDQFSAEVPLRVATDFVDARLGGSGEYVVSIRGGRQDRFLEPVELQKLEALQQFLVKEVGATTTASFTDHVKLMNRGFNDDAPEAYRLPDTREQVAQMLLLNGDDRLFDFIDRTSSWVRVTARTTERSSAKLAERFEKIDAYLQAHFPAAEGYDARGTGGTRIAVAMSDQILGSQTSSFLLSFLLIFVPITLLFGSLAAGAFTVPSNLFPILAVLGLMGWLDIPLSIATTMITSIVLGIAVDDTIHFIQNMRRLLGEGRDLHAALHDTMATKGVGAMWITVIITSGFGALIFSNFKPTSDFGVLTAFAMVAGVAAEFFLLPPLLVLTRTRLGVKPPAGPPPA